MSNENDIAVEIGRRLKRARQAKGLSQEQLAEKANTSAQNISKFEKNGLTDIRWIQTMSEILGQDLQKDVVDVEGSIGEVGKEILFLLTKEGGYISTDSLAECLYGMNNERINHEIFKLESIGMVVREEYHDWHNDEANTLFITAKGYISFKNLSLNDEQKRIVEEKDNSLVTYEKAIGDYGSYQEYIDNHYEERLIRLIDYDMDNPWLWRDVDHRELAELFDEINSFEPEWARHIDKEDRWLFGNVRTDYRINYIAYLKWNFENCVDYEEKMGELVPGVSCYHDILYCMALGLTRDVVQRYYLEMGKEEFANKYDQLRSELCTSPDTACYLAWEAFGKEFDWIDTNEEYDLYLLKKTIERTKRRSQSLGESILAKLPAGPEIEDAEVTDSDISSALDGFLQTVGSTSVIDEALQEMEYQLNIQKFYEERKPAGGAIYPIDWFTYEEIKEYIEKNLGPAVTEEEKRIDQLLSKINKLCPATLKYYNFPREWEENGLADLVRKNFGIVVEEEE